MKDHVVGRLTTYLSEWNFTISRSAEWDPKCSENSGHWRQNWRKVQAVANTVGQNSALILVLRPNISASVSGQLFCEKREGVQKMVFSWKPFLPMGSSRQRAKAWNALQPSLIVMMRHTHTHTHTQNIAYVGSKLKILYHKHCICMCNNITHNRITGRATIAN